MKYTVIKDFGSLRSGDVLEPCADCEDIYSCEYNDENTHRSAVIGKNILDSYLDEGYIKAEEEDNSTVDINKLNDFINEKLSQYEEDYNDMIKAYNEHKIPTCAKVEAETVYYNMQKLLNKFKELVNE